MGQNVLETEWKKRPVLPPTRSSLPPSSAQKVHGTEAQPSTEDVKEETPSTVPTPAPPTPAPAPVIPAPPTAVARIIAPSQQSRVPPTASTSQTQPKPGPLRPKSAQQPPTPDIDVDVVSPDSDAQDEDAFQAERDPQSEEIVKQLEKGLPRWPGFGDEGWMDEINPVRDLPLTPHVL